MSGNEPQTEPFCNVENHPFGLCNIEAHPNYPELMDADDKEAAPYCFIPSHPELLVNNFTGPSITNLSINFFKKSVVINTLNGNLRFNRS